MTTETARVQAWEWRYRLMAWAAFSMAIAGGFCLGWVAKAVLS